MDKETKIFNSLSKLYNKKQLILLTEEQRKCLLYFYGKTMSRRFACKGEFYTSPNELLESIKNTTDKMNSFIKENNLSFSYIHCSTINYNSISMKISGYLPVSDEILINEFKKRQEKIIKQKDKRKQAKVKNRFEALKEIQRLERKFQLNK